MLKLCCIGNLTRDPESRTVQRGEHDGKVCNFTVAASYGFGEYKRTEFIRVAAWNGLGATCEQYLRKGSKVYVSGTPSVNNYTNSEGNPVGNFELRLEEIEFLSSKPAENPINDEAEDETEDIDELL